MKITGVGMFDFLHGQTGVAPNGIEVHPILDIVFNPGTTADFTVGASPTSLSVTQGSSGQHFYLNLDYRRFQFGRFSERVRFAGGCNGEL